MALVQQKKLYRARSFAFAPKFNGFDLFDEEKLFGHHIPKSGISYAALLEEVYAAWMDNTSYYEFKQRDVNYQAFIIAAYRIRGQTEAVLSEDSRVKAEIERARAKVQESIGIR